MKLYSAYDTQIKYSTNENGVVVSLNKKILDATLSICRKALGYIIPVLNEHYDEWSVLTGTDRSNYAEHLIHSTKKNKAVCDFDTRFYKFPSGIRRSAVAEAIGIVSSYRSNHKNWELKPEGKEPKLSVNHYWMPVIYRTNPGYAGGELEKKGRLLYKMKVFHNNDWVWMPIVLDANDVSYIERHCTDRKELSPAIKKSHDKFYLTWAFEETSSLVEMEPVDYRVCAVDMGILTDATCTIMDKSGTVYARGFINCAYEKDQVVHLCNRIKGNQQRNLSVNTLWAYAKNFNSELSRKVANKIVDFAIEHNADCIVFEHLDTSGKKHGSKKQRLHLWKHREIQQLVGYKAHRYGLHVTHVCAWGTSKYAFDGSGKVKRGCDVSDDTPYDICKFTTGKMYNCDLSASYNIGARFFLREIKKLFPDYDMPSTPQRTLSTLWQANAVLFSAV